jgi:PHP family Zn ribbon phosphoesterase
VSFSPKESLKFGNVCPVCRRKLTKGVQQRVEELADRPIDFRPEGVASFMRLLPLHEIITTVLGVDSPATQKVWSIYTPLIEKFGDEYTVLTEVTGEALASVAGKAVADAIVKVREGRARVVPGYDGVYGKLVLSDETGRIGKTRPGNVQQLNLADFT